MKRIIPIKMREQDENKNTGTVVIEMLITAAIIEKKRQAQKHWKKCYK